MSSNVNGLKMNPWLTVTALVAPLKMAWHPTCMQDCSLHLLDITETRPSLSSSYHPDWVTLPDVKCGFPSHKLNPQQLPTWNNCSWACPFQLKINRLKKIILNLFLISFFGCVQGQWPLCLPFPKRTTLDTQQNGWNTAGCYWWALMRLDPVKIILHQRLFETIFVWINLETVYDAEWNQLKSVWNQ